MAKEPTENIYNILLDIREKIGGLNTKQNEHDVKLDQLIVQTTRTNGRVTKLEDNFTIISNAHAKLVEMTSKQNGIYEQNLKVIEHGMTGCTREIDELKKKVNTEELGIKGINTEYSGKIKLTIVTGVITILTIIASALFVGYRAGSDNNLDLPTTITNINK